MAAADDPQPEVTAKEWLAAHSETMRMEDPHREITDLVDNRELDDVRLKSWKILRKIRCSPTGPPLSSPRRSSLKGRGRSTPFPPS